MAPTDSQHPIRGGFLDPRGQDGDGLSGYHFGIDISVNDRHREHGVHWYLSHSVYALESGVTHVRNVRPCYGRRMRVGHFVYWHVSATVYSGEHVKAGQKIGWTCRGEWHVHVSEWQMFRGVKIWVNPLHAGSPLRLGPGAYKDKKPPVIGRLIFVTPPARPWRPTKGLFQPDTSRRLSRKRLHGRVELRANIMDPQSYKGFLKKNPVWLTAFSPYRVAVKIRAADGRIVMDRISFQADQIPQTPYLVHYAPGTVEDRSMHQCYGPPQLQHCAGTYWFRPFSRFKQEFWDTRTVPNGAYFVTVYAWGIVGKRSSKTTRVRVLNPAEPRSA